MLARTASKTAANVSTSTLRQSNVATFNPAKSHEQKNNRWDVHIERFTVNRFQRSPSFLAVVQLAIEHTQIVVLIMLTHSSVMRIETWRARRSMQGFKPLQKKSVFTNGNLLGELKGTGNTMAYIRCNPPAPHPKTAHLNI